MAGADTGSVPPPPSDPLTPSEHGPGTPNSTTTSLSALSVIAIKDGAVGHTGRGGQSTANTLEAERNDRISRLAGLERVGTIRAAQSGSGGGGGGGYLGPISALQAREISTVGDASATESVGDRTTWASEMDYDGDKMSEDHDDGVSSVGGFSDADKGSLVDFGEGAGSTVSGPVSTANARILAARNSIGSGRLPMYVGSSSALPANPTPNPYFNNSAHQVDDGDETLPDAAPPLGRFESAGSGAELANTVLRGRLGDDTESGGKPLGTPPDSRHLGRFPFEKE